MNLSNISNIDSSPRNVDLDTSIELIHEKKFVEARDMLKNLVDEGVNDAYLYLGYVYEVEPENNPIINYDFAYFYHQKSFETTSSADAFLAMAVMNYNGSYRDGSFEQCAEILLELVEQRIYFDGLVFWMLGRMNLFGQGMRKDIDNAISFFRKGWELNHVPCLAYQGYALVKEKKFVTGTFIRIYAVILLIFYNLFMSDSPRVRLS